MKKYETNSTFQYIICVGSRLERVDCLRFHLLCFNTSYVSVQGSFVSCLFSFGCGFNTSYVSVQERGFPHAHICLRFQYIICVGSSGTEDKSIRGGVKVSIHHMCRFKKFYEMVSSLHESFNTSYVSVQESTLSVPEIMFECFNTSYVSVQEK